MKKYFALAFIISTTSITPEQSVKSPEQAQQEREYDDVLHQWILTLADAFYVVREKYFKDVNPEETFIKAINAFVTIDPHSGFLDPKTYKEMLEATSGEFYGIGIIVNHLKEVDDENMVIIETIGEGPADKAGLKAGDKIVQIEEESLKGMTIEEAISKLKGKRNTKVHVKVLRPDINKLLSFDITRDVVKEQQALSYYFNDHDIYYLALTMFSESSKGQIEQLLKKIVKTKSKGLILDLRNNTGGLVSSVTDIAGLFIPKNSLVVYTQTRNKQALDEFKTTTDPLDIGKTPIFILVNNFTASAAEILAGALQIYSKKNELKTNVFIVGTTTFGKGSMQEVIPVSNDSAIKLTIGLYLLPGGISIQAEGITPDFVVEQKFPPSTETDWFNKTFGREKNLKAAVKNKKEKEVEKDKKDAKKELTWQERKQEQIRADYQIASCIRLIEFHELAQKAFPDKMKTPDLARVELQRLFAPDNITLSIKEAK